MKNKWVTFGVLLIVSQSVLADGQCGPFRLSAGPDDGYFRINGVKPISQKVNFLKQKDDFTNVELFWRVADPSTGQWYALDYTKQNGKAMLNVEQLQSDFNAPRVFGSYDCVHIK